MRISFVLTLVVLLLAPRIAAAQEAVACAFDRLVQPGDSLSSIAALVYGDTTAYTSIVAATNRRARSDASYATIEDPNVIEVGWKLCIPVQTAGNGRDPADGQTPALPPRDRDTADFIANATAEIQGIFDPEQIRQLSIVALRERSYPGSAIVFEETLTPGVNYQRHIVSYRSEGLKIHALMTIPAGEQPPTGWPVILFNHGYLSPEPYRPTERYESIVDGFARNGYIVFRSDYRGHGASEGQATGYTGPDYTVDVLNALSALQAHPQADPDRIGMWGHSLGGDITLRAMVVNDAIKAGVIWSGMVISYGDLLTLLDFSPIPVPEQLFAFRQRLFDAFGTPQENPAFWDSISPNSYLGDLSGPLQLHHGGADAIVPVFFSSALDRASQAAEQGVEFFVYAGDDHNLTTHFDTAMARSIQFFDRYVKGATPAADAAQTPPNPYASLLLRLAQFLLQMP